MNRLDTQVTGFGRMRLAATVVLMAAALAASSLIGGGQAASARTTAGYWATDGCYYAWNGYQYVNQGCNLGTMDIYGKTHRIYGYNSGNFTFFRSYEFKYNIYAIDNVTGTHWYYDGWNWLTMRQVQQILDAQIANITRIPQIRDFHESY